MSLLVGICGGSGSGKSTLASAVLELLGSERSSLLSFDSYYNDHSHLSVDDRAKVNYDHPDSLDSDLFARHLQDLSNGESVNCPVYDFATHSRMTETEFIEPAEVIVVDGILILWSPDLSRRFDLKVYRSCPDELRLERRILRDTTERGRTEESVQLQWAATVKPMHDRFVFPSRTEADLVFDHTTEYDAAAAVVISAVESRLSGRLPE